MNNQSFDKSFNNSPRGGLKVAFLASAFILAAACGKVDGNSTDPNNAGNSNNVQNGNTANGNTVGNGNKTTDSNATGPVTSTEGAKTGAMNYVVFTKSTDGKTYTIGAYDYDYCAWAQTHGWVLPPANKAFQILAFEINADATGALAPGNYAVGGATMPLIGWTGFANNCTQPYPPVTDGAVTITSATADAVSGSVNLTVKDYDGTPATIKGQFTTKACSGTYTTPPASDPAACPAPKTTTP